MNDSEDRPVMEQARPAGDDRAVSRRAMLAAVTLAAAGGRARAAEEAAAAVKAPPSERVRIAVMGVNGRGGALAKGFAAHPQGEVVTLCDVDSRVAGPLADALGKTGRRPRVEGDIRRVLDDREVDAIVVATPNHWHAPATILACRAGKHVYVEKPCSHTPEEGELAVAAARKAGRVVTMGTQRRSWPGIRTAIDRVHAGAIGEVRLARTWYAARRGPLARATPTAPPAWLDWTLWQGPAPERPFREGIVHYHWHWHWHWGDGELGNNGIHALDLARWALRVDFPTHVTAGGGRLYHDDDQETPDTMGVTFTFPGGRMISWEGLSCVPVGLDGSGFGAWLVGTEGSVILGGGDGWKRLDPRGRVVEQGPADGGDAAHLADFLTCVTAGGTPHADIAEAHKSTLLCHLGNIAWRTGGGLATRAEDGHILDEGVARAHWGREYRDGWDIRG